MASRLTHWFLPHYTNNHRPKLLQPIGLVVVLAMFMIVQFSLQMARIVPHLPGGFVLGYASSITPEQVLDAINAERAQAGLAAVSLNSQLNQAALAKANYMFLHDFWAHVAPDGTTPWDFIKASGYAYSVAGENLARDFSDTPTMVKAWMDSETHRANIIHPKYTQTGIAVVNGTLQGVETTLVVQLFGAPTNIVPRTTKEAATTEKPVPVPETKPVDIQPLEPVVTEAPSMTPLPQISQVTLEPKSLGTQVKVISPLKITKVAGTALIVLLVLVLIFDSIVISKKNLPRRVGNNWAHIGFFGIVLLIIILMTQGRVV